MRNTLKIRTRILAGLLAAATTVSAFTAVGTTAFAEEAVCVEEAVAEEAGKVEAAACDQFIEEPAADAFVEQDTAVAAEEFAVVDVACDEAQETFVDETGGQVIEMEAVFDASADAGYVDGAAVEEGVEVAVEAAEEVAGAPADEAAAEEALVGDPAEETLAGDPAEALDPELNPELDLALKALDPALDPAAELAGADMPQEDKALMMTELINETVAANEEAGIYAALDSTFTVLADNAGELTDPANGIKKIDSETMITATYDALAANFDNSSEELYGAIGAAAARASDNGLIKAMKDDGALSALAKQEKKEIKRNRLIADQLFF